MQIEISRTQAQFILEAINQKPYTATLGQVIGGLTVKLGDDLQVMVKELEKIANTIEEVPTIPPPSEPIVGEVIQ